MKKYGKGKFAQPAEGTQAAIDELYCRRNAFSNAID
jgi:hypothetical protein